jgi:transketolase
MRQAFCNALVNAASNPDFVFLTGDLGYLALEPLRDALGPRFINAGIAEQNMVSVAAGLAGEGLRPWVYSIAPFVYARPFEQIRNDVCLHDLPVVLVGNGGGYGYGVMGSTHHAIEDYGALLSLPNMHAWVPAFDGDVGAAVSELMTCGHPAYLRLGLSEEPKEIPLPAYGAWRKLLDGDGATLLAVGPLAGGILSAAAALTADRRPSIWLLSELPIPELPEPFLADVARSQHLLVVEEHVAHGGAAEMLAHRLLASGNAPRRYESRSAGQSSGLSGSQKFYRKQCGLDPQSVLAAVARASACPRPEPY